MTNAVMIQASPQSKLGFQCYGAAREFWRYQGPEVILAGPYETGKTIAALHKFNALLAKYPGARGLMVRKTYTSLINSAVVTYEHKVLAHPPGHPKCPIQKFGKSKPEWYDYPNGSRLVLGGMDNPDKFLSAEFDYIYVNQAEELQLDDWEKLTGRATGRAGGAPYPQVMGDCNPGLPRHWIKQRRAIQLFPSQHEDNPTLYDPETGAITEQGRRTMKQLDALTGVRYKRGRLGLWAGQEGQVYEGWNPDVHLIDRFEIPESWERYRSIDFGYRNPFSCSWWAIDEDGRMYQYRQIYMTERTVRAHAEQIKALSEGEDVRDTVTDHDAEDRATLEEHGISTVGAVKTVQRGIEKCQERLQVQGDGRPRVFFLRDSLVEVDEARAEKRATLRTTDEFDGYVFPSSKTGKAEDERPIKVDDHGLDEWRYMVMYLEAPRKIEFSPNPFF